MSRRNPSGNWPSTLQATAPEGPLSAIPTTGLEIVHSPDAQLQDRVVTIGSRLRIGRRSDSSIDLVVGDPRMSGIHAVIEKTGAGAFTVIDLGSRNGTWLNGEQIEKAALMAGDIIRFGRTFCLFGGLPPDRLSDECLIGRSALLLSVVTTLERSAPSSLPVLLLGETGTGKELAARRVHDLSGRSGSFVALNCGAIPTELVESVLFGHKRGAFTGATADALGVFREAYEGTLFLDEVGELPLNQQPKLLRALETHEIVPVGSTQPVKIDVRVLAATNADLPKLVQTGGFRRDLYARLAGIVCELPPLRRRRSDILRLTQHFLAEMSPYQTLAWKTRALERLLLYDWPMNVRELRRLVERIALQGNDLTTIGVHDLESLLGVSFETGRHLSAEEIAIAGAEFEPTHPATPMSRSKRPPRSELVGLMAEHNGNVTQVARQFGKNPRQIYRWLKSFEIDPNDFRSD